MITARESCKGNAGVYNLWHRISWRTLALLLSLSGAVDAADTRILFLDFGLSDGTMLPRVPAELARNALLAPYLRAQFRERGYDVALLPGSVELTNQINSGYLSAHPEVAAALGRQVGAEWVALGQQNKFSFLISWLNVQLVDVSSGRIVARAESALRGGMDDNRMTKRTIASLAEQLDQLLRDLRQRRQQRSPHETC